MQHRIHTCTHLLLDVGVTTSVWEVTSSGVTNVWLLLSLPLNPAGSFDSLPVLPLHYPSTFQPVCPCTYMTPLLHPAHNLPLTLVRSLWTWLHLLPFQRLRCCVVSQSETSVGCVSNAVLWGPCVLSWPGLVRSFQLHTCIVLTSSANQQNCSLSGQITPSK